MKRHRPTALALLFLTVTAPLFAGKNQLSEAERSPGLVGGSAALCW